MPLGYTQLQNQPEPEPAPEPEARELVVRLGEPVYVPEPGNYMIRIEQSEPGHEGTD